MTAKEKLLEEAPGWTDAQATAALRAVETQAGLAAYFDEEAKLSANELDRREDRWAEANAREALSSGSTSKPRAGVPYAF